MCLHQALRVIVWYFVVVRGIDQADPVVLVVVCDKYYLDPNSQGRSPLEFSRLNPATKFGVRDWASVLGRPISILGVSDRW